MSKLYLVLDEDNILVNQFYNEEIARKRVSSDRRLHYVIVDVNLNIGFRLSNDMTLDELKKSHIMNTLIITDLNIAEAAKRLDMSDNNLRHFLRKTLNLKKGNLREELENLLSGRSKLIHEVKKSELLGRKGKPVFDKNNKMIYKNISEASRKLKIPISSLILKLKNPNNDLGLHTGEKYDR